jgi:serine/threonine-protein kinase
MSMPGQDLSRDTALSAERYEFGTFRLDPTERLLTRAGQPVALTPKAFDLLAYLVERPGRLVEKRDLMAALWPDTVVEEANLAYTVSALRKALGDGQEGEQFIQTVPTRGYRFVAAVAAPKANEPVVAPSRPAAQVAIIVAGAVILGAAAGAALMWWRGRPSPAPKASVTRFELPETVAARDVSVPAVSPDGRRIVFAGRQGEKRQLFVRSLDTLETAAIPGTAGGRAFFSPDGRSLAYCDRTTDPAQRGFIIVDLPSSTTSRIAAPDCGLHLGGVWGRDGMIYFARVPPKGLARVAVSGGAPQDVTVVPPGETHGWPDALPDGQHLLFTVWHGSPVESDTRVLSLATGEVKTVLRHASRARFVSTGHLVFAEGSSLLAVSFDPRSLETRGTPVRVMEGVATGPNGMLLFQASPGGTLAYHRAGPFRLDATDLAWLETSTARVERLPAADSLYVDPVLSPDGRKLAVAPQSFDPTSLGGHQDVWVHDFGRHTWTRVTSTGAVNAAPVWHPLEPERLVYSASHPPGKGLDLFTIRADGSDSPRMLYESEYNKYAGSSAPAAGLVAFTERTPRGDFDIWLLDLHGKPAARPFLQTPFNETTPALSPEGRWIAYDSDSNAAAGVEVYVRPVSGEGQWQISADGGDRPRWSRDGRTIVYRRLRREGEAAGADRMMAVTVATEPSFAAGAPRVVAEGSFSPGGTSTANYDVSADGRRLLLTYGAPDTARVPLVVVENWAEELRQKVGH